MYKAFIAALGLSALQAGAFELDDKSKSFLEKHCYDCHDEDVQKGDLDLTKLKFDLEDKSTYKQWTKVFDNVLLGEMPPKKKKRPEEADIKSFLENLEKTSAGSRRKATG